MPERRRLPPEDRRSQLLDLAKVIIERDGVGACTVDAVSRAAEVTPQLVHKYFGTRTALLQDLFAREDDAYQADIRGRLEDARTFEDVVRVFVESNIDLLSPATAIGQLRTLPELASTRTDRERNSRRGAERVLVGALQAEHAADPATTEFVLRLGSAASIEAASLAARRAGRDRSAQVDRTVRFILAGIREVVDDSTRASQTAESR